ncbi:MAG: Hsp20/alpha crystallin family protein [Solirubrobacterales bacterium]
MAIVRWDPGRELDTLQGEMNRLFDGFFGRAGSAPAGGVTRRWVPPMDLVETDDSLILRADLPGLKREEIEIEVKDGVLTVSGERRAEHEGRREGYHRVERSFGRFSRSLGLPKGIRAESVSASFEDGVLEVKMPKPVEVQPTRIEVTSGEGRAEQAETEPELVGAGSDRV